MIWLSGRFSTIFKNSGILSSQRYYILYKTKPTKRPYKPFFNNEHLDKIDI